jgi:hypothetical protein
MEERQMRWDGDVRKRVALVALAVVVTLGGLFWGFSSLRADYHLRSAIELDGIVMTGGGAGWTVGEIGGKPNTILMRADAGHWTILPKPAGLDDMAMLQAVAMTSPQDGWLIAQNPIWKHDRYNTFIPGSVLLRYHTGQWRIASQSVPHQLWALTMRMTDDGWAVGSDGAIIHWNGAAWSQTPLPPDPHSSGPILYAIAAPSATEAWTAGLGGAMLRWDGATWHAVDLATQLAAESLQPVDSGLLTPNITGLAMTTPGEGWAVGSARNQDGQNIGEILVCHAGQWRIAQSLPGVVPHALALDARGDGWAVGDNGVILRVQGGRWSQVASPTSDPLLSVSIAPDGQTWAVGRAGRLLREQQGAWSLVSDVTWSQAASASFS